MARNHVRAQVRLRDERNNVANHEPRLLQKMSKTATRHSSAKVDTTEMDNHRHREKQQERRA